VFSGQLYSVHVVIAEDLADDGRSEEKVGRKLPCQTAVDDETEEESQSFHSSRTLNRRSLSLVGAMNTFH